MNRSSSFLFYSLSLVAGISLFTGCQSEKPPIEEEVRLQISRLEEKLEKLELRIGQHLPPLSADGIKTPDGPIKSLTFRLGTKYDRLRIHW